MIKGIIFDMDGVLTDTEPINELATNTALKKLHGIELDKKILMTLKGMREKEYYEMLRKQYGFTGDLEKFLVEKKNAFEKILDGRNISFPATGKVIKGLKKNYKLALATSCDKRKFDIISKSFDKSLFDVIIVGEDVTNGKPHPECYRLAIKKLGLKPDECVVIEDAVKGIIAAKSAGAKCIGIAGTFPKEELEETDADLIIAEIKYLTKDAITKVG